MMPSDPSLAPQTTVAAPSLLAPRHLLPLLLGIALTLTLRGYQFGSGNHTVYLVEPLREVHPELLAHDWWTHNTLQYHVAFNQLTALLMRLHIVEPAFLCFYLAGVVLLHLAWLRLTLTLGGDARVYLCSVLLYYLSAAGTALGSYQFLQDSSFLPGNVANVAMLWGLLFWIEGRTWPSALTFALAALFHLNYTLIALAFWPIAHLLPRRSPRHARRALLPYLLILLASLPPLLLALRTLLAHHPRMPLGDFVNLYVHLRHPHHYDPLTWPLALWLSFLWPIPLALLVYRRQPPTDPLRRTAFVFLFFSALLTIAFLFAGVLFISEPLIQMSLFRFSIYVKLLSCLGAAAFLLDPALLARKPVRRALIALPLLLVAALVLYRALHPASPAWPFLRANTLPLLLFGALAAVGLLYLRFPTARLALLALPLCLFVVLLHNRLGLQIALADDEDRGYLDVCRFARDHTPVDALFVVPPNEQLFRFHARRAIVVNFKNVPQLSSEIPQWRERLETLLGQPLAALPRRFDLAHAALAARYAALSDDHLTQVARRYGARYLVTTRPLPTRHPLFENARYHLYDLSQP